MLETLLTFLAIVAVIAGVFFLHVANEPISATLGVILLAGGLTRLWMKSTLYRKN